MFLYGFLRTYVSYSIFLCSNYLTFTTIFVPIECNTNARIQCIRCRPWWITPFDTRNSKKIPRHFFQPTHTYRATSTRYWIHSNAKIDQFSSRAVSAKSSDTALQLKRKSRFFWLCHKHTNNPSIRTYVHSAILFSTMDFMIVFKM